MAIGDKARIEKAIEDFERVVELNPDNEKDIKKKIQQVRHIFITKKRTIF